MALERQEFYYDSEREEYIHRETGEVLEGYQSHPLLIKKRSYSGKPYAVVMQPDLKHLASLDIKPASIRVFLWMAGSMSFGNEIKAAQTTIADELGLTPPTVSKAISELVSESLIIKSERIGTSWIYRLNANIAWKGAFGKREQYAKHHPTLFKEAKGEA